VGSSRLFELTASRRTRSAALCALLACAASGWQRQQAVNLEGEYGLVVFLRGDSLHVHWLTATPAEGRLEIFDAAARTPKRPPLAHLTTHAGLAHHAVLRRPRQNEISLRYGSAASAAQQHETTIALAAPHRAPFSVPAVDSLYVVGDTHGMYDELLGGLRNASLIDADGRWAGGRKQLVFAGDLMDRGPDVVRLLWFVYRLEREAAAAGGRVHVVLGNHELMVLLGDLRYVHPKEAHVAELHGISYDRLFDVRAALLGRWLASKPGVLRVGRVLVAHGGVTPEHARQSLQQLNDSLNAYMREDLFYFWNDSTAQITVDSVTYQRRFDFLWDENSLFWHRGYILTDTLGTQLAEVLRHFAADVLVLGHTPTPTVQARYDGRVIAAHSQKFGAELVLLVRKAKGYERFRVGQPGPPVAF
jgi:hypothetical protein